MLTNVLRNVNIFCYGFKMFVLPHWNKKQWHFKKKIYIIYFYFFIYLFIYLFIIIIIINFFKIYLLNFYFLFIKFLVIIVCFFCCFFAASWSWNRFKKTQNLGSLWRKHQASGMLATFNQLMQGGTIAKFSFQPVLHD